MTNEEGEGEGGRGKRGMRRVEGGGEGKGNMPCLGAGYKIVFYS